MRSEVLQAQSDEEIQGLQEKFNDRLQSRLDAVKKAAGAAKSYDQDLQSDDSKLINCNQSRSHPPVQGMTTQPATIRDALATAMGSDYWLNTGTSIS